MKNWWSISLTSPLYKMATNVIACRLKKVLLVLISQSQNSFIKGRFIGERTRVVSDVMNFSKILKIVDFEKAFDSVRRNLCTRYYAITILVKNLLNG